MNKGKFKLAISVLLILLIVSFMVTLCWGTYKVSPMEVINTLLGNGTKLQNTAILTIRVPRLLVGMFVAIALSTAGAILQTITKNDLADTGIIGINAGAAVAAVLFITYSTGAYYSELGQLSIFVLPVIAIIGAAVTAFVIYMMSSRKGIKPKRLLLIGIGLNAGLNAFITFFTFRGGVGDYNRILVWTSGSLWGSGWSYAKVIIPIVTLMFIMVLLNHKKLDVLNLSDELAISLGLNLEKERKKFLTFAVILAGTATAFAGNIGFLGLISPHIARKLVGPYHKKVIIVSAMISVIIVILADSISRNLFSPIEIPVGITVSIWSTIFYLFNDEGEIIMEAISVKNLRVGYENNTIIEDMSLSIPKGKISIIIGANGCGKSTLLKTIARINKPTNGDIFINNKNIKKVKEKNIAKEVAFLPQGPVCPDGLTVRELVAFGRFPHQKMIGGLTSYDKEIIDWAIEETGLSEFADRGVENLSGGQRQRAWIAMTLAQETEIIMLDEPTTYLDMSYQLEVLEVLQKLNKEKNITVVIVLHELNNACRFADNIIGLKKGKIICQGRPLDVINKENLKEIYGIDANLTISEDGQYPICMEYDLFRGKNEK